MVATLAVRCFRAMTLTNCRGAARSETAEDIWRKSVSKSDTQALSGRVEEHGVADFHHDVVPA